MNYLAEKKLLNDCKMLNWLATLSLHNYEYTDVRDGNSLHDAKRLVNEANRATGNEKVSSDQEPEVLSAVFKVIIISISNYVLL